ncbi:ABC transporter permease [Ferruginibacter sp. HRS2-29]|uniref:ABC transporter permease n=1 Tax=Ferruginibacter sp. HRS2-29 TaxID=2487334 RepID=UPI0020CB7E18|nr:ABC transporter permease [Ferruginibacter sp. HRS2-29]MCP9749812.1 FtsX-like permease family protein [Ferruginibacter sp. HRS2-29]
MFKNYFKIAVRHLWKNKTFTAINIFGLSIGIAFTLLIGAYIWSELQVNKNISHKDEIFLLQSKWKDPSMGLDFATLAPLSKALKENYPNLVENYYHHDGISSIVSKGDKHFTEGLQVGDASFLEMMGFPLIYGNASTALDKPTSLVLTASKAIKYFGTTNVIGQTLTIQSFSGSKQDFEITGVMKDPPQNTINSWGNGINKGTNEFFLPASSLRFFGRDAAFEAWQNAFVLSYVQLKKGVTPSQLQAPIAQLIKLNTEPSVQKNLQVYLTPVKDYYLQSNNGIVYRTIWALGAVALFILFMAMVNFVNISVGNSVSRLKEIGVRKVMGSDKRQLIIQFLTESIVLVAFSVIVSLLLYAAARPFFGNMLNKELTRLFSFPLQFAFIPIILTLLIGVMAGIYPAFVLSRQRSLDSLKGKLQTVKEKIWFRHSLIGLQFVTAIVVFVAAVFINEQVKFFLTKDLGYKKDQVITAKVPRDWTPEGVQKMISVRNQFASLPGVISSSFSYEIPDGASASMNNNLYKAAQDSTKGVVAVSLFTDEKYRATYGIPMAAGDFFNEKGGNPDSLGVVLNETAVKALGWKNAQEAIGQQVKFEGNPQASIVGGVVKDFNFGTLHESIKPMYFIHVQNAPLFRYLSFKINTADTEKNLASIQKKWSSLLPGAPFEYVFMDDTLARLYSTERQMKLASGTATGIALVIVLLGVLGIVTQTITRRTKEVGIRKVLGASVAQVLLLFGKEFSILLIIANCIAWPVTWLFVNRWLTNYAYRIDVTWFPFISVGILLAILTGIVIVLKTIKIAFSNPVKNLRTE